MPEQVEVVGWGPDVAEALDRAEAVAVLALNAAIIGTCLVLVLLAAILMLGFRR